MVDNKHFDRDPDQLNFIERQKRREIEREGIFAGFGAGGDSSIRIGRRRITPGFFTTRGKLIALDSSVANIMPNGRIVSFRKRGRKRKRKSMASLALSKVRKLERKQEVKMFDIAITIRSNIAATGVVESLALISQGDGVSSRDGLKLSPFALEMRFQWLGDAASVDDTYRTIIFRDRRQVASTVPTVASVLAESNPLSRLMIANRTRWKILYDETFSSSNDAAIRLSFVRLLRMKLSLPMEFSGTANTTISKNGLFMIILASSGSLPNFTFNCRLKYNDL